MNTSHTLKFHYFSHVLVTKYVFLAIKDPETKAEH